MNPALTMTDSHTSPSSVSLPLNGPESLSICRLLLVPSQRPIFTELQSGQPVNRLTMRQPNACGERSSKGFAGR